MEISPGRRATEDRRAGRLRRRRSRGNARRGRRRGEASISAAPAAAPAARRGSLFRWAQDRRARVSWLAFWSLGLTLRNDLALDPVRLATKQRHGLAALVPDLDVIDAGAAARRSLLADRGQHIVLVRRSHEIDAAPRRDRGHVGAVAGERE